MRTAKRAIIRTITVIATLAAVFFGNVGVAALIKSTTYAAMLAQVVSYLPFIKL